MTSLGIVKVFCEIKSVEGAYYMTKVRFYEEAADELLKFAVIIAKSGDKWILLQTQGQRYLGGARRPQGAGREYCGYGQKRAV